jgi:hypothetical protein
MDSSHPRMIQFCYNRILVTKGNSFNHLKIQIYYNAM